MRRIQGHQTLALIGAISTVLLARSAYAYDSPFSKHCSDASPCMSGINDGYGYGMYAESAAGPGLYATSTVHDGVHAVLNNSYSAVAGLQSGSGDGVYASATSGFGVYALATTGNAVYAYASGGGAMYAVSNSATAIYGTNSGGTLPAIYGNSTATSGGVGLYGTCSGTSCIAVQAYGDLAYSGALIHTSDERVKRDIASLDGSLEQLLRLRGVSFYWREPPKHGGHATIQRGFIAQDYEKVFPEWVSAGPDGLKMIDTAGLDALEVESIRSLKSENDELRVRTSKLEDRLAALEAGHRPLVGGLNLNGIGFGIGGLALAGAFAASRRRRTGERSNMLNRR